MARDGGSSALADAVTKPRDDRQKDLLQPALEAVIDITLDRQSSTLLGPQSAYGMVLAPR